jgi:hypothetical protein
MTTDNRIKELQKEYFEFCLGLLQKLPEDIDKGELASRAYHLRDELSIAIVQYQKDFYGEGVKTIQAEIEKLKTIFHNKAPDE